MKKIIGLSLFALAMIAFTRQATAININVERRDMKLATQQLLEKLTLTAPIDESTGSTRIAEGLLNGGGDGDGTGSTLTTFLAQPDFARNLSVIPMGSTGDIAAGNVVITGTDYHGSTISETFAFTADQTAIVEGNKAFLTITSISFPAESAPYDASWSVGVGNKFGLHRCMTSAGHLVQATFNAAKEGTDPTAVADATTISNNTAEWSSQVDGSDMELFYIQNFRCSP